MQICIPSVSDVKIVAVTTPHYIFRALCDKSTVAIRWLMAYHSSFRVRRQMNNWPYSEKVNNKYHAFFVSDDTDTDIMIYRHRACLITHSRTRTTSLTRPKCLVLITCMYHRIKSVTSPSSSHPLTSLSFSLDKKDRLMRTLKNII